MENVQLDNTQNRNLAFVKIFAIGLLILLCAHFLWAEQNPNLADKVQENLPAQKCKSNAQPDASTRVKGI
jgi:hypothetical protein